MSLAYGPIPGKNSKPPACYFSGWALFEYVFLCHAIWWVAYWFLIITTRQSEEWCCRLLTFVHGCVVSCLTFTDILCSKTELLPQNSPLSEAQKIYLSFMLSYFLFDFFWIHLFGKEAWIIYFHHVSSILIIANILYTDFGGVGVSYAVVGLELTNPYLQLRWFLRTYGYLNTPLHIAVELWFFFLFFLFRLIGGTVFFYYTEFYYNVDLVMKISFASIYFISLALAWQIFFYIKKKYWNYGFRRRLSFITSRISLPSYFQFRTRRDEGNQESSPQINVPDTEDKPEPSGAKESEGPSVRTETPEEKVEVSLDEDNKNENGKKAKKKKNGR